MHSPKVYAVTHAQRYYNGLNGPPVTTAVTVHEDGKPGAVYLTARGLGCSRTFPLTGPDAIVYWLQNEHAQTVHAITEL